ncbi:hypothetical protein [Pelosinus propionicus]|uniref:Uncharacterized protein n=1 Tax=Pelosinus propionicus DSM 13327 TaxID=1123291 RepID=A0A1I4PAH7_9FIRM|nr:hypothetical protein [Pelosinus propionicus]SFM24771.1 hypothetical protein SAMN04490355_106026 [Pelosinus propionicus DSM 13327]
MPKLAEYNNINGGYVMKRVLLLVVLFMLVLATSCFAESSSKDILNNYKDIKYALEAGVNYRDFRDLYMKANLAYRRFSDENKESVELKDFNNAIYEVDDHYKFYSYLMSAYIESSSNMVKILPRYKEKYPELKDLKENDGRYYPELKGYVSVWQILLYVPKYENSFIEAAEKALPK